MNFYTACSSALEHAISGKEPESVDCLAAAVPLLEAACRASRHKLELGSVEEMCDAYQRTIANAARYLYRDASAAGLKRLVGLVQGRLQTGINQ